MTHSCKHCKGIFAPKRRNQYYCSQTCRQKEYLLRNGFTGTIITEKVQRSSSAMDEARLLIKNTDASVMIALLSLLNTKTANLSMTENLTDNGQIPTEKRIITKNPSIQNHAEACVNHVLPMQNPSMTENVYGLHEKDQSQSGNHIFNIMLQQRLTIPIGKNGYIQSIFPHWTDREWKLSVLVNEKMLDLFECLKRASFKGVIAVETLQNCLEKTKELCDGIYGMLLPVDYPFSRFLRLLTNRLTVLTDKVTRSDKKEIPFSIADKLIDQMFVIKIQIRG